VRLRFGQITALINEIYLIEKLNRKHKSWVDRPASLHSFSRTYTTRALCGYDANAVFIPLRLLMQSVFEGAIIHPRTREINWNVRGLSVTAPTKLPSWIARLDRACTQESSPSHYQLVGAMLCQAITLTPAVSIKPLEAMLCRSAQTRLRSWEREARRARLLWSLGSGRQGDVVCAR